jgi:hypothetical protein
MRWFVVALLLGAAPLHAQLPDAPPLGAHVNDAGPLPPALVETALDDSPLVTEAKTRFVSTLWAMARPTRVSSSRP